MRSFVENFPSYSFFLSLLTNYSKGNYLASVNFIEEFSRKYLTIPDGMLTDFKNEFPFGVCRKLCQLLNT